MAPGHGRQVAERSSGRRRAPRSRTRPSSSKCGEPCEAVPAHARGRRGARPRSRRCSASIQPALKSASTPSMSMPRRSVRAVERQSRSLRRLTAPGRPCRACPNSRSCVAQREAVGHARHVVGHLGDAVGVGVAEASAGRSSGWTRWWSISRRMTSMACAWWCRCAGRQVDALEHEVAQLVHVGQRPRRPCAPRPTRSEPSMTASIMPADPGASPAARSAPAMAGGKSVGREQPGAHRVERVVGQVGDAVGVADADGLLRSRAAGRSSRSARGCRRAPPRSG